MKFNIATKLFLGFLVIIALNAFFVIIVSKFSSLNNITSILKSQNEIKNKLLQISSLHVTQAKSRLIFSEIGLVESAESFKETGTLVTSMIDSVLADIRTIIVLDSIVSDKDTIDHALQELRVSLDKNVAQNNKIYNERFDEFLVVTSGTDTSKTNLISGIIDTADSNFRVGLRVTHSLIDNQNKARIREIGQRIDNLRNLTQLILLGTWPLKTT